MLRCIACHNLILTALRNDRILHPHFLTLRYRHDCDATGLRGRYAQLLNPSGSLGFITFALCHFLREVMDFVTLRLTIA